MIILIISLIEEEEDKSRCIVRCFHAIVVYDKKLLSEQSATSPHFVGRDLRHLRHWGPRMRCQLSDADGKIAGLTIFLNFFSPACLRCHRILHHFRQTSTWQGSPLELHAHEECFITFPNPVILRDLGVLSPATLCTRLVFNTTVTKYFMNLLHFHYCSASNVESGNPVCFRSTGPQGRRIDDSSITALVWIGDRRHALR